MLDTVLRRLGGYERIAELGDRAVGRASPALLPRSRRLRARSRRPAPVDKQPFAMNEAALIHRLFPDARFLFVERHPCDAVLSNFITRFEPNPALANFVTLEWAARLYDRMMTLWTKSRELLPLRVHEVRYERLVASAESEMRALIEFLGLDWNDALLDNRATAQGARVHQHPELLPGGRAAVQARRPAAGSATGSRWSRCSRSSPRGPSAWGTKSSGFTPPCRHRA